MFRRPPGSTRTDPLFPYPTLFRSAVFQFPGGLADHLKEQIGTRECATAEPFTGRQDFPGDQGRAEWAIAWPLWSDGSYSWYCNTIPTPAGGTHEAGLRAALTRGLRAFGDLIGPKKAAQITAEDRKSVV